MSILIGRIENKFWSNSGHKFPNGFPIYAEQEELKSESPNMNDFMSGTIYLHGDSWNHCKYDGAYYSLYILHLVSHRSRRYLYRLERDLWMDILIHRPQVVGDLANSNNDKLLEANLNRTVSALDNPARVITINFKNIDFNWRNNVSIKLSKRDIEQVVLSKDNFNAFIESVRGSWVKNWKTINNSLYSFKKFKNPDVTRGFRAGSNDATFIFGCLEPSVTTSGWKNVLRKKVNEFVNSILESDNKEIKLAKVNVTVFETSPLTGKYCITHKQDGISTTEENIRIDSIDLSGLTDIIPVNIHNLKEKEPDTPINEGKHAGLFDVVETKTHQTSFFAKIRRKAYIPINSVNGDRKLVPDLPKTLWPFSAPDMNWSKAKDPQIVDWSFNGEKGTFNLWFVDNLNFIARYYETGNTRWEAYGEDIGDEAKRWIVSVITIGLGYWQTAVNKNRQKRITHFNENSFFNWPIPFVDFASPFDVLDKENVVPFGFLIYGLQRRYREWRKYEYIGNEIRDKVKYYSGIRRSIFSKYAAKDEWWSDLDSRLSVIQPSPTWTKFYLDNYYFSWLCFFPQTKRQRSWWEPKIVWNELGTFIYTKQTVESTLNWLIIQPPFTLPKSPESAPYTPVQPNWPYGRVRTTLNRDIHDKRGNWRKQNPFNDQRFPSHRDRVDRQLTELIHLSDVSLPQGVKLEKGDYLFTDQDYEIVEYPPVNFAERMMTMAESISSWSFGNQDTDGGQGGASDYEYAQSALPGAMIVEDMVEVKGGKLFANVPNKNMVVLCTTRNGSFEIRTLQTFERLLEVNSSSDEIIVAVDGSKTRTTQFTLLKKLKTPAIDDKFKEFTDEHKEQIIHAFYKANGYKTTLISGVGNWIWFEDSDFEKGSDVQQLFDLVGTDWYAFSAKGKISLIAKRNDLFSIQTGQTAELDHVENKDLKLSLVEKINQKVRFQFFNAPYYLNWKTSFSDKDKINLTIETLKPTTLKTQFDQYFVKLDTEFDTVYYENISLAKKQDPALDVASTVELERLNLDLNRAQYAYQIDVDRHKLAVDRFDESIKRAEIDLYHQQLASWMNLGSGVAASSFGVGLKWKYGAGKSTTTTIKKSTAMVDDIKASPITLTNAAGVSTTFQPRNEVPTYTKKIKTSPSKYPNVIGGLVSGALSGITGTIMDHAFRFPEQKRRIGVDKQLGAAELALDSLAIDTRFIESQINHQAAINRITNTYTNPVINEREVMENFMDKDEWHGKKLKPAHLICFVPSEEQLVALKSFKEEYGVMCDIPDVEMVFYEGMNADVVRYRNLDDDAIKGLPNEWMRVFLHGHLLAGIKIVKTTFDTYELLTTGEWRDKVFRLNSDLLKKADEIDAKDKQIVLLNAKVVEVEKECGQAASELQKRITSIENEMNVVNEQLRAKIAELEKAKQQADADKAKQDALNQQIEALKKDMAQKVEELEKAKTQAASDKSKQDSLTKEIEKLKQDLNQKVSELEAAKTQSEADKAQQTNLTKQIEQLQQDLTRKIEELGNVQKQYESDKGKHEATSKQLADAQKKIADLEKIKKQCDVDKRDKANLTRQLNEAKKQVTNLTKSLNEKTTSLSTLQSEYQAKNRELDLCRLEKDKCTALSKEVEDLKKESETRKERVEELTQQLNDERRKFLDEQDKANRLDKQYKESQQGYQQLMASYRRQTNELNECKKKQATPPATPPTSKEDCSLLQRIIRGSQWPEMTDRDNGWNTFLDLLVALAYSKDVIMTRYNPDKGWGGFADAVELAKFIGAVNEIMDLDVVQKAYDMIKSAGWEKYKTWLETGGDKNGTVDAVIAKFNKLKEYDEPIMHHGLKVLLDKANYEAYQVITNIHEKIGRDPELANYIRNVYPGLVNEKYEAVYGDPNIEIVKGRFINETQCVDRGVSVTTTLKRYEGNTKLKDKTISTVGTPIVGTTTTASTATSTGKFARSIEEAAYCGVLLDTIEIKWPYANPLFIFEDGKKVTRNLENVDYKWTFDGKSYTLKDKPKITMALQFWDYTYNYDVILLGDAKMNFNNHADRLRETLGVSGVTIVNPGIVKEQTLIWFWWRTKDLHTNKKAGWQVKNYMVKQDMKRNEMKEMFNFLISSIDQIKIPKALLDSIKDGTRTLRLRQRGFNFAYDPQTQAVVHASKTVSQPNNMILKTSINLKFGSGNSNEYLQWPEDKIEDLLKYLFIFHYLYVSPELMGKDVSYGWWVYFFITGSLHPIRSPYQGVNLLGAINSAISKITDKNIDLQLGWLFNGCDQRMWVDGDMPLPSGVAHSNATVLFMSLFRWIYGHVSGKKKYDHPYDWGQWHIFYMFHRMSQA